MSRALANPCRECPFKRTSPPGFLGVDSARNFIAETVMGGTPMPCHMEIDYDDPDWRDTQLPDAPDCEGALRFLNNLMKLPRDPRYAAAVRASTQDTERIFASVQEFMAHHDTEVNRRTAAEFGNDEPRHDVPFIA